MRENTNAGMAKVIAATVVNRRLDILGVVRFCRAVQVQMGKEISRVEWLSDQRQMSVLRHE